MPVYIPLKVHELMLDWFIRLSDCIDLLEDMERKGLLDMDKVGFCTYSFLAGYG